MTSQTLSDTRVLAGMGSQLAKRKAKLASGGKAIGWKAGFGAPAALKTFALPGPLAGFMMQENVLAAGAEASLKGWIKPVAEPEVAIWFGRDLADGVDPAAVKSAIKGLGPAIELADMEFAPEDITRILDANIYHRHVILGPCDETRAGAALDGLVSRVTRNGKDFASVTEIESNTGRVLDVAAHVASTLAACGEKIRAGDVLICGSITPPIFLDANDTQLKHGFGGIGSVSVRLSSS